MECLKFYLEDLYESFYKSGRGVEKYHPRINDAIKIYNSFFSRFYKRYKEGFCEKILLGEFTDFISNLASVQHEISIVHEEHPLSNSILGLLWDGEKNKQMLLWPVYTIEIFDCNHINKYKNLFPGPNMDIQTTVNHEFTHIIEKFLRNKT